MLSWMSAMWSGTRRTRIAIPGPGTPGSSISSSRQAVWELSAATTRHGPRGTREFAGTVKLPPGTYEAFYSAFPNIDWSDTDNRAGATDRFMRWLTDEGLDDFALSIHGNARVLSGADADRARLEYSAAPSRCCRETRGARPAVRVRARSADRGGYLRRGELRQDARVRLGVDHQRRHPREDLEADVARLGARRRGREEPLRPHHAHAAGRPLRGDLRDRRLAQSQPVERAAAPRSASLGAPRSRAGRRRARRGQDVRVRQRAGPCHDRRAHASQEQRIPRARLHPESCDGPAHLCAR